MHHNHTTGDYIDVICNICNLQFKYTNFILVYIHNCKGYDGHFLVDSLNKYGYKENDIISCIPSNEEKYISFSKKIKLMNIVIKEKMYFVILKLDLSIH